MISTATILISLGFIFLYNTSKRAVLTKSKVIEKWLQTHDVATRIGGVVLVIIASLLLSISYGIATGIFISIGLLMIISSLVIIIKPLKFINYTSVFLFFLSLLIVENIVL